MAYQSQDNWSSDYDYLVDLGHQIESSIRDGVGSKRVHSLMQEYQNGLDSMRKKVSHKSNSATTKIQRERQLNELSEKLNQLNQSLLLRTGSSRFDDESQSHSHTSRTGPGLGLRLTADQIQERQKQMIDEQDRGLEAISATLRRQQKVGLAMQDEIAEHNVIIDDISAGATLADNRIKRETQRIEERRKKEKTWCTCILWTTVLVLFVVIIIVSVVPSP